MTVDASAGRGLDDALREQLRFAPDAGQILLYGQRMLLFHASAMAELRRELIERLGTTQAREITMRLGYQQGVNDGARVREDNSGREPAELLAFGPRLRELEGFVRNQPIEAMVCDSERGAFFGDYLWTASFEAQAHLDHYGVSGEPACWIMLGYANGYCTAITGMPILWREIECVAMGHAHCRVVGRALSDWGHPDTDEASLRQIMELPKAPCPEATAPASVLDHFVGSSAGFRAAVDTMRRGAKADATVLLQGESGVGKERFARALHAMSRRADGPWVAVNCAAIPEDLIESELFGVERGAYTGADRSRPGRFERADGGTLFLDEVASLPLSAQGKLLRVLQEREVERVGDTRVRKVDVRLVAAANLDLREEVARGRFRADLFYRLNVYPVTIPALRDRRDDIPLLVSLFLQRFASRYEKRTAGLTRRAHRELWSYDWPGNVRELENIIERAVIRCDDDEPIDSHHLFAGGEQRGSVDFGVRFDEPAGGAQEAEDSNGPGESSASKRAGGTAATTATAATGGTDVTSGTDAADAPHASSSKAAAVSSDDAGAARDRLTEAIITDFESFEALEQDLLRTALRRAEGNLSAAARMLKMGRGQFEYRLRKPRSERGGGQGD